MSERQAKRLRKLVDENKHPDQLMMRSKPGVRGTTFELINPFSRELRRLKREKAN